MIEQFYKLSLKH